MSIGRNAVIASLALTAAFGAVAEANAKMLFKGIAVITARSATPACALEYDISESFVVEYMGNVGAETGPEKLSFMSTNGALMLTSNDGTPTLRGAGQSAVTGHAYTQTVYILKVNTNFNISAVGASTQFVTMTGSAANFGIPGCTISIRAALTLLPPGGY